MNNSLVAFVYFLIAENLVDAEDLYSIINYYGFRTRGLKEFKLFEQDLVRVAEDIVGIIK